LGLADQLFRLVDMVVQVTYPSPYANNWYLGYFCLALGSIFCFCQNKNTYASYL